MKEKLTPREIEILVLISDGYDYKEIAKQLILSPGTIISHKKNIMRKMRAKNVAHLVKLGIQLGWI